MLKPGVEYFVNFKVIQKEAKSLIPSGHIVAIEQFRLPITETKLTYTEKYSYPPLNINNTGNIINISSYEIGFVFDKPIGSVTSYKVKNNEYFKDGFGIRPNFWRGPNDNDYGNGAPQRLQTWKQSSKNFNIIETKVFPEGDKFVVYVTY